MNWNAPSSETVAEAFKSSGLDNREIALLVGAVGEVKRVVAETLELAAKKGSSNSLHLSLFLLQRDDGDDCTSP